MSVMRANMTTLSSDQRPLATTFVRLITLMNYITLFYPAIYKVASTIIYDHPSIGALQDLMSGIDMLALPDQCAQNKRDPPRCLRETYNTISQLKSWSRR
eukprot:1974228-Amphidinium_carterae.1